MKREVVIRLIQRPAFSESVTVITRITHSDPVYEVLTKEGKWKKVKEYSLLSDSDYLEITR